MYAAMPPRTSSLLTLEARFDQQARSWLPGLCRSLKGYRWFADITQVMHTSGLAWTLSSGLDPSPGCSLQKCYWRMPASRPESVNLHIWRCMTNSIQLYGLGPNLCCLRLTPTC